MSDVPTQPPQNEMPHSIPEQLQRDSFRFVLLDYKGRSRGDREKQFRLEDLKKPFELNWQTTNNYLYTDNRLIEWLKNKRNVGIVCGYDNLTIIDCDNKEIANLIRQCFKTFEVETGSGGTHLYFFCPDVPHDEPSYLSLERNGEHYGELRIRKCQCIIPPSIHPNGNRYKILSDVPILTAPFAQLKSLLADYIQTQHAKNWALNYTSQHFTKRIEDIVDTSNFRQHGDELQGAHPIHDSKTGQNLCINTRKQCFHCFRHNWGGNILHWIAMMRGIINCGESLDFKKREQVKKIATDDFGIYEQNEDPTKDVLLLPTLGRPISKFAAIIGNYFADKTFLFFRPSEKSVVKLGLIAPNTGEENIVGFQKMSSAEFITYLENYFNVGKMVKLKDESDTKFLHKSLTKVDAEITLESSQLRNKLPIVDRIYTVPMPVVENGILSFPQSGYDKRFLSWLPLDAPSINTDMSLDEARQLLDDAFAEFCFKTPQDKINAVAALLTPFCRKLYSRETCRTPIFFYKANRERAGKDYCAGITGIVYEGCATEETPIAIGKETNDEEFRKKVLATFLIGRNRIHSSNNRGFINSAQLEALSTSETWADRQLGTNTRLEFPNTLELSLSANSGITYTPDLSNRCIFINLFLELENPNERRFKRSDLHTWIADHRSDILSALYALVRHWHLVGMPAGTTPYASYPEWARVVGGIMENAGYSTPCVVNDESTSIGGDTETRDMKRLFELCYEIWTDEWIRKKQVMDKISTEDSDFSELFSWFNWSEPASARARFGKVLDKFVGRIFSDIHLYVQDNERSSRKMYKWSKGDINTTRDATLKNENVSETTVLDVPEVSVKRDVLILQPSIAEATASAENATNAEKTVNAETPQDTDLPKCPMCGRGRQSNEFACYCQGENKPTLFTQLRND